MSIMQMVAAWKVRDISGTDKLVLLALADWANDEGLCWPSLDTLAKKSSLNRRTVMNAIGRLENAGLIRRETLTGKGTKYWLTVNDVLPREPNAPVNEVHPTRERGSPNTTKTHQIKDSIIGRSTKIDWPDWLPLEAWVDWVNMRKSLKKPLTERAIVRALSKLDDLRMQGHEPEAVLDQSTDCCWTGLYPLKEKENGQDKRTFNKGQKRDGFTAALDASIGLQN